jgi:ABC-type transport system involved in multi-copper enzyme maturation permease subunit
MISVFSTLVATHLRGILRDRILYGVIGMSAVMILLVPALSNFSMRQVQELSITLSLSVVSGMLLVVTLLLGASSIWRDIERRYTSAVLPLPLTRSTFLLSKFFSITLFLLLSILVLGAGCGLVIWLASSTYPSETPIHWGNIVLVLCGDLGKYTLLTAFALLLSSLSTSFFLPFFGTLVIYFCGSASQEVYEYVTGEFGQELGPVTVSAVKSAYFLLPNFSAFDYQVQAVYGLPIMPQGLLLNFFYMLIYTSLLLVLAVLCFERRELP